MTLFKSISKANLLGFPLEHKILTGIILLGVSGILGEGMVSKKFMIIEKG